MGKRVVSSHQLKEPGIGGGLRAASSAHLEEIANKRARLARPLGLGGRRPLWEVLGELPQVVILGGKTVNARRVVSLETKEHGTAPASESSETSEPAHCTLPAHSDLADRSLYMGQAAFGCSSTRAARSVGFHTCESGSAAASPPSPPATCAVTPAPSPLSRFFRNASMKTSPAL